MRTLPALMLASLLGWCGCGHTQRAIFPSPGLAATSNGGATGGKASPGLIVAPETVLQGKVVRVNRGGRFLVLNFPIGHLPSADQQLSIYRLGLKVGEVKVTGPQMDDNVVGDLVAGDAAAGDQVRDR